MERHYRTCPLCEAMCGLEIEAEGGRVRSIRGDADDVFSRGHICPKAVALSDIHEDPDRIRRPQRRQRDGSFVEVSWSAALDEAAERLEATRRDHGPDAVGLYIGNPSVHSYATLLALAPLTETLRTRNRYSATSADQLPHMHAALQMFGHQLLLPVPDLDRTDHLLILGANPAASNGSIMSAPGVADRLKAIRSRGGRVVVVDPRRTETAALADAHHPIRPGTDALLLLALLCALFEEGLARPGPWQRHAAGLAELERAARRFPPERVAAATTIPAERIRAMARALAAAPSAAVYGRVGACTQRFGGTCAWLLYALNTVTGNLDRPGGMMLTRPAWDLAGAAALIGQRGSFDRWRTRVSGLPEFGGEQPVAALAEEIDTPGPGRLRALLTVAGNPVLSTPNGGRLDRALPQLDTLLAVDMYRNETTRHAHLLLPPTSPLEHDHYDLAFHMLAIRNTAKHSPPLFPKPPGALHDWEILLELSERLLAERGGVGARLGSAALGLLRRLGPERLLDWGLRLGPYGLRARRRGGGLSLARLRAAPHGIDLGPLEPCLPARLATRDRKVQLAPPRLVADLDRLERALEAGELAPRDGRLLLIGRRDLRSNNSWMHNSRRLVKGRDRCTLLMHPTDAAARGVTDGARVAIRSRTGAVEVAAALTEGILPGVVSLPHGWGHGRPGVQLAVATERPGASLNDLTDERHIDALTGTAAFSGVPVEVAPSEVSPAEEAPASSR